MDPELRLERTVRIHVEPGIFEWTKWEVGRALPHFMGPDELKEAGFSVSTDYRWAPQGTGVLGAELLWGLGGGDRTGVGTGFQNDQTSR